MYFTVINISNIYMVGNILLIFLKKKGVTMATKCYNSLTKALPLFNKFYMLFKTFIFRYDYLNMNIYILYIYIIYLLVRFYKGKLIK